MNMHSHCLGKPSKDAQHPDYVPSIFSTNIDALKKGEKRISRYNSAIRRQQPKKQKHTSKDFAEINMMERSDVEDGNIPLGESLLHEPG